MWIDSLRGDGCCSPALFSTPWWREEWKASSDVWQTAGDYSLSIPPISNESVRECHDVPWSNWSPCPFRPQTLCWYKHFLSVALAHKTAFNTSQRFFSLLTYLRKFSLPQYVLWKLLYKYKPTWLSGHKGHSTREQPQKVRGRQHSAI